MGAKLRQLTNDPEDKRSEHCSSRCQHQHHRQRVQLEWPGGEGHEKMKIESIKVENESGGLPWTKPQPRSVVREVKATVTVDDVGGLAGAADADANPGRS